MTSNRKSLIKGSVLIVILLSIVFFSTKNLLFKKSTNYSTDKQYILSEKNDTIIKRYFDILKNGDTIFSSLEIQSKDHLFYCETINDTLNGNYSEYINDKLYAQGKYIKNMKNDTTFVYYDGTTLDHTDYYRFDTLLSREYYTPEQKTFIEFKYKTKNSSILSLPNNLMGCFSNDRTKLEITPLDLTIQTLLIDQTKISYKYNYPPSLRSEKVNIYITEFLNDRLTVIIENNITGTNNTQTLTRNCK